MWKIVPMRAKAWHVRDGGSRARSAKTRSGEGKKHTTTTVLETRSCEHGAGDRASDFMQRGRCLALPVSSRPPAISGWPSARSDASRCCLSCSAVLPMSSSVMHSSVCQRATRVLATRADVTPAFRRGVPTRRWQVAPGHTRRTALQASDASRGSVACAWRSGVVTVWSLVGCVWCSASSAWRSVRLRHSPAPACTGPRGRRRQQHRGSRCEAPQSRCACLAPSERAWPCAALLFERLFPLASPAKNFASNRIGSQPPPRSRGTIISRLNESGSDIGEPVKLLKETE